MPPRRTYKVAHSEIMDAMVKRGWDVRRDLKFPRATYGHRYQEQLSVWFKPQGIYTLLHTKGWGKMTSASSAWLDTRKVDPTGLVKSLETQLR